MLANGEGKLGVLHANGAGSCDAGYAIVNCKIADVLL